MNRLLLFAFVVLIPAVAHADATPAETARAWGLVGRWADDCTAAKAISFEIEENGRLVYDNGINNAVGIDTAVKTPEGHLVLTYFWPVNQKGRTLVVEQKDGLMRSVFSRDEQNNYTIRDGVFVSSGKQTQWLRKCPGPA